MLQTLTYYSLDISLAAILYLSLLRVLIILYLFIFKYGLLSKLLRTETGFLVDV